MRSVPVSLTVCLLAAAAGAQTTFPLTPPVADDLAGRSLRRDALDLIHGDRRAPGRAGRLVVLSRFAHRLTPHDLKVNRLRSFIAESMGDVDAAAEHTRTCLKLEPDDWMQWLRWVGFRLSTNGETVEQRLGLLGTLAADGKLPKPLRAELRVRRAELLAGQGENQAALAELDEALKLDDRNAAARMRRVMLLGEKADTSERVATLLALLKVNPADVQAAGSLGTVFDRIGMHETALVFHRHVRALVGEKLADSPQLLQPYLDALLAAGQPEQVISLASDYAPEQMSPNMVSLLIQANRAAGREKIARQLLGQLEERMKGAEEAAKFSTTAAIQLAALNLLTFDRPEEALGYARRAIRENAESPLVKVLLGGAEALSEDPELQTRGRRRLQTLGQDNAVARMFLVKYYLAQRQLDQAARLLRDAETVPRTGQVWRETQRLAKVLKVTVPKHPAVKEVRPLLAAFDKRYLELGATPGKFLSVTLRTPKTPPTVGEPVEITAELSNNGPMPVTVGPNGLLNPTMALVVGLGGEEGEYSDLPLVTFPSPRHLRGGQSVSRTVRLDVAELGEALFERPLNPVELSVGGVVSPVLREGKVAGRAPIEVAEVKIVRDDVLPDFDRGDADAWATAYRRGLGLMVRDMKRGTLSARMRQARQLGSLLLLVRRIEKARLAAPDPLKGVLAKPVLLTMLRETLKDESPVVRAEMLAALQHVPLDGAILNLIAVAMEDPSALVRMRFAELIGASRTRGNGQLLEKLIADESEPVREMVKAFGPFERDR